MDDDPIKAVVRIAGQVEGLNAGRATDAARGRS